MDLTTTPSSVPGLISCKYNNHSTDLELTYIVERESQAHVSIH